jgi:xanthine/CO dehydrogenase XdhC/CoxF family maturation factor
MRELREILERIETIVEDRRSAALATVIATSGSTYRRPGARMLITESDCVGAVSAGCLEEEVISVSRRVIETGRPERLRFDTTEEMDVVAGTGLGCRGTIDVFVEPLDAERAAVYRKLRRALDEDRVCELAIEVGMGKHALFIHGDLQIDELRDPALLEHTQRDLSGLSPQQSTMVCRYEHQGRTVQLYLERIDPPPKLVVFGAGYDAQPLVRFAKQLGFRVTVVDHRPTYLTNERFPCADALVLAHPREAPERVAVDGRTFLVILTHNYFHDLELLKWTLPSQAPYVGQIGPRTRTEDLLAEIEKEQGPLPVEALAKLHAPVGLDLGAETPEEIALSVLSEILAVKSGRTGRFLRERQGPIHGSAG